MATHFVGIYWGPREESRRVCAERLSAFFHALSTHDSALSQWFEKATSRKAPLVAVPNDPKKLVPLLKTNRRDTGGETISELGFSFSAWTGREAGISASLAVTCGAYSPVVRNSVVVSFDAVPAPALELLRGVLRSAVVSFDPADGVVSSTEALSANPALPAWRVPSLFRYHQGAGFSEA